MTVALLMFRSSLGGGFFDFNKVEFEPSPHYSWIGRDL